jgi:hypothetical protein
VLNSSQQVGGSLGTALLNTVFASSVTSFFAANLTNPADVQKLTPQALISGYHTAFAWGGGLLIAALVVAAVLINAKKDDVPSDPVGAVAA